MKRIAFFLVALLASVHNCAIARGNGGSGYWSIVTSAIASGGPNASEALALLGTIDDQKAQDVIQEILSGTDGSAISDVASGLSPEQSRLYIQGLKRAALDPSVKPKLAILSALARAGTEEAARVLAAVAEQSSQPNAGAAFGLLEKMGVVSEPMLLTEAVKGSTAWSRETAADILRRMGTADAAAAFNADIQDKDPNVRIAGALGLAHLGNAAGISILEAAAKKGSASYQADALVALAALGQVSAFRRIRTILNGSDESEKGRVVWAIARSENTRLKALSYSLGLEHKPEFQAMLAAKLLQPSDPRDLNVLKQMLTRCDRISGIIAAQKLADAGLARLVMKAVACGLASPHATVRRKAADLAVQSRVLQPVLEDKLNSHYPAVQIAALEAIRKLSKRKAFGEVEQIYLQSSNRSAALTAAKVLASLEPEKARQVFERAVANAHDYIKVYAAAMLLTIEHRSHG